MHALWRASSEGRPSKSSPLYGIPPPTRGGWGGGCVTTTTIRTGYFVPDDDVPNGIFRPWARWDKGLADFRDCARVGAHTFRRILQSCVALIRCLCMFKVLVRISYVPLFGRGFHMFVRCWYGLHRDLTMAQRLHLYSINYI